ncbi:Lipoprotein-releasing system transmembrane protein LolE [wastewater metagenome]|uniref:Lipoprotein-releasing system transmembrane protein LolE n=2 Tax=unclassified sequences TaxID=12908 RepID=A0A5B8RA48_9ZZZZ|nr:MULTISPECIES: lipoprotein-releasing ABC transporter permease subunit [Arhodomonas]MCS4503305.1 lipoprotein-releasing ABC transporter permease subunit [Arhodomonas aquaeolei]QEA05596.1 lipoprotein-releasing system transmembrane protein LolE [uncultured organism]
MFKPLQLYIGLRYTRARRRNHFVSFISASSMLGIAVGVTALITVLSVMNGFESELRDRILGMVAHGTVSGYQQPLEDWAGLTERLGQRPEVKGAAPYVRGEVMITRGKEVTGALIRGVLPDKERGVSSVDDNMVTGSLSALTPGDYGIVLGQGLADRLGVGRGDTVTVVAPEARVSVAGVLPRLRRFHVVGVFSVDMSQYDNSLALIQLKDAQTLFRTGDAVTGIRLEFDNLFDAPRLVRQIAQDLPGLYRISDWTMQNRNFFRAVQTEKTVMFVILLLIVGVAAFNIVSTLVMVVTDKRSDIAILRTLGASPRSIMGIFIVQGAVLGIAGTLIGVLGGVALALNVETIVPAIEQLFHTKFLPADVYLISTLPSELHQGDVVHITLAALGLSLLATLYPAWRASRVAPAEALRYE